MGNLALRVEGLGKMYRIGGKQERYATLRDTLTDAVTAPFKRARSLIRGEAYGAAGLKEEIWALKDVSFEVKHGEVVGIIGRNGAGKSTLLKILSRITEPTEGYAEVYGRVGSLLEVGTGFHPELTGRENIYLNGAILGMSRAEIDRKFDEIVDFAGIEKFIDTPVKHYSSGMGLRLGFAVAAHLEPEILVVDEVLAVGDAEFQKKCLGKMSEVAGEGRTVLFVSHNMGAVESLCTRGIWLDIGKVREIGTSRAVIESYMSVTKVPVELDTNGSITLCAVKLKNSQGREVSAFRPGDDIEVEVHYKSNERIERPHFWFSVIGQYGQIFGANMALDGLAPEAIEGDGLLSCRFKSVPLVPQQYTIRMAIRDSVGRAIFDPRDIGYFTIFGAMADYGFRGARADHLVRWSPPIIVPYEWHFEDGEIVSVQLSSLSDQ